MLIREKHKIMGKKALCLIFAFLLSIESFAAVVSDNDGSAFITKSEFDSLKNNFQSELDSYNTRIDSKIDDAIVQYLTGIKINSKPRDFYSVFVGTNGSSPKFYWNLPGTGYEMHKAKLDLYFDKELSYKTFTNLWFSGYYCRWSDGSHASRAAGLVFESEPNWGGASTNWRTVWKISRMDTNADSNNNRWSRYTLGGWGYWNSGTTRRTGWKNKKVNGSFNDSSGVPVSSAWLIMNDNGHMSLFRYQVACYPFVIMNIHRHVYRDFAQLTDAFYLTNGGKTDYDTAKLVIDAGLETKYGTKEEGTNYTGDTDKIGNYIKKSIEKVAVDDGIDYTTVLFPVANDLLWYLPANPQIFLETSDTQVTIEDKQWYDVYYPNTAGGQLQTNKLYGIDVAYKKPYFKADSATVRTFEVPTVTSVLGSVVHHGDGFPLFEVLSDKTNYNVKIKMKNDLNSNDVVRCLFSNKKLNGDSFDTTADVKETHDINCNNEAMLEFNNLKTGDIIWINPIYGTGNYAIIDSFSVELKS